MVNQLVHVLLVEDSSDDATLVIAQLRLAGYELQYQIVASKEAFLAAIEAPGWDIILSDFGMPRFDGLAAFELLRRTELDIPFIFVSGHIGEDRAADAIRRGASDYVLKDNLAGLAPAVERALRGRELRRGANAASEARQIGQQRLRLSLDAPQDVAEPHSAETQNSTHQLAERLTADAPANAFPPGESLPEETQDATQSSLSRRQKEVLLLIAQGKTTKEIASTLGIADKTAEAHRWRLMEKLNIHDTAGLVRYAIRYRLVMP